MSLRSVLTLFEEQVAATDFGVPIDVKLSLAPRQVSVQLTATTLYIFPRLIHQSRKTMAADRGFRNNEYRPMDFTLRQSQPSNVQDWTDFAYLAFKLQALLSTIGDAVPIPIADPVVPSDETYLISCNETDDIDFQYAPVLTQTGSVTFQARLAAQVEEQQQGPGVE